MSSDSDDGETTTPGRRELEVEVEEETMVLSDPEEDDAWLESDLAIRIDSMI